MSPYTIAGLLAAYSQGARPRDVIAPLRAAQRADDPAWILRCDDTFVDAQLARLERHTPAELPLYGVPFAVKDNIDVAGLFTTAGCPAYAYTAGAHATCVQRLLDAGAVLLGKTNLDQFATGLVGTRSPYGAVPNSFDARYVSGGSSSGSASVVARGLVAFALGTDTAGSGRVPAGFNNIVGCKPTPGRSARVAWCRPAPRSTRCRCSRSRWPMRRACSHGSKAATRPTWWRPQRRAPRRSRRPCASACLNRLGSTAAWVMWRRTRSRSTAWHTSAAPRSRWTPRCCTTWPRCCTTARGWLSGMSSRASCSNASPMRSIPSCAA
jgi:hypothetical protein